jgi:hypothetical protein
VTLTTTSRPLLAVAATLLCVPALAISVLDGDSVLVAFFAALSVAAGVVALLAHGPWAGWRRGIGMLVGIAWIVVGIAIALFLGSFRSASFYHLVAICGGGALIVTAVFAPERLRREA